MSLITGIRAASALGTRRTTSSLSAQRAQWAEAIRAPMRNHPGQMAFATSTARKRVVCANRRAGKTEGIGREDLARAIEQDGYICWVFAETYEQYSRNWLGRKGDGPKQILRAVGVPDKVWRKATVTGKRHWVLIEFPEWESEIRVLPAAHADQIADARGGRVKAVRLDEAQHLALVTNIIKEMGGPAGSDFKAEITMSGTPGTEVDTYFHQATTGALRGWEIHEFYSWNNPRFGTDWASRFDGYVLSTLRELQDDYGVTDEQLAAIHRLTEPEALLIARAALEELPPHLFKLVSSLDPDVLREFFGRWVADAGQYVFPVRDIAPEVVYWSSWAEDTAPTVIGHQRAAQLVGEGTCADLLGQVDAWPARMADLPRVPQLNAPPRAMSWRALIGADFGFYPDPFALLAWLWSSEHTALFELDSGKAGRLSEPEQLQVVTAWARALRKRGVQLMGIIADAGGAEGMPVVTGWADKLRVIFDADGFGRPMTGEGSWVIPAQKFDGGGKFPQIWTMNTELRRGRIKLLRNSPLDLEARHLQWEKKDPDRPGKRREIDKARVVHLADGRRVTLGDHCLDAGRYAWFYATHAFSEEPPPPEKPKTWGEQMAAAAHAGELAMMGRK